MKTIEVVIAIILGPDGRILISRRRRRDSWGGYWEFPGGKQEPGESESDCLARELREELAITVDIIEPLPPIESRHPAVLIRLHPYLCNHTGGTPQPLESDKVEWILPADLNQRKFPPANNQLIRTLITRLTAQR